MFYKKQMKQKQIIKANKQTLMCLHKAAQSPQASAAPGFKSQNGAISRDKLPHPPKKPAGFYLAQGYPCSYKELTDS